MFRTREDMFKDRYRSTQIRLAFVCIDFVFFFRISFAFVRGCVRFASCFFAFGIRILACETQTNAFSQY